MQAIRILRQYTWWPQKVTHCQIIKKSYYISLKPTNEIRFLCQIKLSIKHCIILSLRDLLCDATMSDPQSIAICVTYGKWWWCQRSTLASAQTINDDLNSVFLFGPCDDRDDQRTNCRDTCRTLNETVSFSLVAGARVKRGRIAARAWTRGHDIELYLCSFSLYIL